MKTYRTLVLEDDLETLGVIMGVLKGLENNMLKGEPKRDIAVTIFSEYNQVESYLNSLDNPNFDLVLLDRDCKLGGSFHALDLEKFGKNRIVGISSVPEYNENLQKNGVLRIVAKDYSNLASFAKRLNDVIQITLQ